MQSRHAFTLIEVLISIALLGIIMMALFPAVSTMRESNAQLFAYLQKAKKVTESTKILYLDILGSDGNLTIAHNEFSRLCIEETSNSLYGLNLAKVCWLVLKEENTLARAEGNGFDLPIRTEENVEVDPVIKNVEVFDVTRQKDKVLIVLKEKGKTPIAFMVHGILKPVPKKKKPKKQQPKKKHNPTPKPPPITVVK